jgi:hypothetical protein
MIGVPRTVTATSGFAATEVPQYSNWGGGTVLAVPDVIPAFSAWQVNAQLAKYQKTIFDLRAEVERYKHIVHALLNPTVSRDDSMDAFPSPPLSVQAATVMSSMWSDSCASALPYLEDEGDF